MTTHQLVGAKTGHGQIALCGPVPKGDTAAAFELSVDCPACLAKAAERRQMLDYRYGR